MKRDTLATGVLTVLLMCSLVLNLFLARQLRTFRTYVELVKSESQLAVGESVPPFSAKDIDGHAVTISYGSTSLPTLLYIFTPDCEWCKRNVANVRSLATEARGYCRFIALSLSSDNLRDYAVQNNLDFPIYTDLPFLVTQKYKIGGTPQSVLVSPEGRVLKNWPGAYSGALQQDVEDYFHIQLPGVTE